MSDELDFMDSFLRSERVLGIIEGFMPVVWAGDESGVTDDEAREMATECVNELVEAWADA